jgi:hypothetical protein
MAFAAPQRKADGVARNGASREGVQPAPPNGTAAGTIGEYDLRC